MDALLDKVTRDTRMKHAARSIKTPTGKHTIKQLDSLESGGCYVAVGAEKFKPLAWVKLQKKFSLKLAVLVLFSDQAPLQILSL